MIICRKIEGTKKIPDGANTVSFVDDKTATPYFFLTAVDSGHGKACSNISAYCRINNQPQSAPSYIQRNGMTPQQHSELSLAKVNAIKEMCISANMTTLENTNQGVKDVVRIGQEDE
jgi:hypothetical protein